MKWLGLVLVLGLCACDEAAKPKTGDIEAERVDPDYPPAYSYGENRFDVRSGSVVDNGVMQPLIVRFDRGSGRCWNLVRDGSSLVWLEIKEVPVDQRLTQKH